MGHHINFHLYDLEKSNGAVQAPAFQHVCALWWLQAQLLFVVLILVSGRISLMEMQTENVLSLAPTLNFIQIPKWKCIRILCSITLQLHTELQTLTADTSVASRRSFIWSDFFKFSYSNYLTVREYNFLL